MKSSISENVILFDWLTVSCKEEDPWYWVTLLHMEEVTWSPMEKGRHGYRNGIYFGNISILYDGNPGMGICLDMSGQGCRSFEEYGSGDFVGLFQLFSQDDRFHITRLDVAFDDHTGILNIRQIFRDSDEQKQDEIEQKQDEIQHFVSKFRVWDIHKRFKNGRPGASIVHGSDKSDVLIRIYDKAAERGLPETQHWVRVELQLRKERASQFAFAAVSESIGTLFRGVLVNYVRYVDDPGTDSNRWRWPMKSYWAELIDCVERISLFVKPGVEYNIRKLDHFVFDMAVNPIGAAIDIYGAPFFMEQIQKRRSSNSKYRKLVEQYGKNKPEMREAFRQGSEVHRGIPGGKLLPEAGELRPGHGGAPGADGVGLGASECGNPGQTPGAGKDSHEGPASR